MYHEDAEREPTLPPREQWTELAVGPGSITWERAADIRTFASAGTALLLQVAHPTVGAGVSDFSTFADDPWGRLWRTLDFVNVLVFAPPEAAAEMGARIRGFHTVIRGTKPDGERYHALEPEAYAWVHMTLVEGILRAHERFGRRFAPAESEQFWREWRGLGRFLGVRWRDMPETYAGYREHVDFIVAERLERTAAVDEVYEALTSTPPPPSEHVGERTWGLLTKAPARFAGLATVALLPSELRARFGLELSRAQRLELRALAAAARRATPLMPGWLRNVGPGYLRWRREPIARGEVASPEANPRVAALMR
jgi:uncharacterized protein (DUF2236 family)